MAYQVIAGNDVEAVKGVPFHVTKNPPLNLNVNEGSEFSHKEDVPRFSGSTAGKLRSYGLGVFAFLVAVSLLVMTFGSGKPLSNSPASRYPLMGDVTGNFDLLGRYIMRDFDQVKPMANFLAGLGGVWGVPMWAFYVNRGQGIASFGIQNKDGAVYKFNTAEKAYQETPFTGFRTFLKGERPSVGVCWTHMPFFPASGNEQRSKYTRNMIIGRNEMEIEESAPDIGLQTNILYFTVPDEDFPALVRRTTFTNTDEKSSLELDVLDGLSRLIPSGLSNGAIDNMGRTMEAWMNVYNVGNGAGGDITQPFFHISQGTADTASVQIIKDGHFAVAFIENDVSPNSTPLGPDGLKQMLPFLVDPSVVFETDTTLSDPRGFFGEGTPNVENILKKAQGTTSRTPCAYAGAKVTIAPRASVSITTIYGHADSLEAFVGKISPKLRAEGFVEQKRAAATLLVDQITAKVDTATSSKLFDDYIKQDFLDNVLRGGLPIVLGDVSPKIFHTFSRIHGDIERDYNFFQIDTTYYSQGPGNFRDVNQNRRLDVFHTPAVKDFNVRMFLTFVQADAYNPLTVASTNFKVPPVEIPTLVASLGVVDSDDSGVPATKVSAILSKAYRPGQLFRDFRAAGIRFSSTREELLNKIINKSTQSAAGQYAQNGFWADHWTYTMDLIDSYLQIFPDKEEYLMWDSEPIPFFMSPAIVKSRKARYSLVDNPVHTGTSTLRVYSAVSAWGDKDFPSDRMGALNHIFSDPAYIADSAGAGGVWQRTKGDKTFYVSVVAKLAILGILKFSTLDPEGMGVEMEGGKPGWNDAMNGLPGILGSGMPETYEAVRILQYLKAVVGRHGRAVVFPAEFGEFLTSVVAGLSVYEASAKDSAAEVVYWDASNTARETYRDAVVSTFSGMTAEFSAASFVDMLTAMETKALAGVAKALGTNGGLSPSYFYYECTDYSINTPPTVLSTDPAPTTTVTAKAFKTHTLPLFLEGPTRHLKIIPSVAEKRRVYELARSSNLYDKELSMYTLSESLAAMSPEIGRMKAFSPGWLENQSVWLHMSYKFYLELLRGELYDEFYAEILTGLVPFMDPKVYGRSPLEAASFIVSSAFPDPKLHGASFLARLSGSTAEFLSMWALMFAGPKPFSLTSNGELALTLRPALPGWLFTDEGIVSFTFLGATKVTYHNPTKANTWTLKPPTKVVMLGVDGARIELAAGDVKGPVAQDVREGKYAAIDVVF